MIPGIEPLERRLDLVFGVGTKVSARLEREGFRTVADLTRHPRYGPGASRLFTRLARRDARALLLAGARDFELAALYAREDAVVVDIETTGLAQVLPLFMIGVATRHGRGWSVRQFLARSFEEEAAVLRQASDEIGGRPVCVSYNGKAFDEPFVRSRLALHGLRRLDFALHVDLLHACRRRFRDQLPDCRLTTVAAHLFGWERSEDVCGADVPDLYYRYVRDGDEAALIPVIEHNAADVQALAWLADALYASYERIHGSDEEGGDLAAR